MLRFFVGNFLRLVLANSRNCFSLIDRAICLDGPFSDDFDRFPRLAARAAPAAICCFFDLEGIPYVRGCLRCRLLTNLPHLGVLSIFDRKGDRVVAGQRKYNVMPEEETTERTREDGPEQKFLPIESPNIATAATRNN